MGGHPTLKNHLLAWGLLAWGLLAWGLLALGLLVARLGVDRRQAPFTHPDRWRFLTRLARVRVLGQGPLAMETCQDFVVVLAGRAGPTHFLLDDTPAGRAGPTPLVVTG